MLDLRRLFILAAALALTACAGTPVDQLEFGSKADAVDSSDQDAAVFSDLNADNNSGALAAGVEEPGAAGGSGDNPFYQPMGGESLGRVAYTLYGDRNRAGELRSINPSVAASAPLVSGQQIFFEFSKLNLRTNYLTKDLLDRYPTQLAQSMDGGTAEKASTSVNRGETLQAVSQRLYGTTRYWTELYLLNRDRMSSYDKVAAGTPLTYIRHDGVGAVAAAPAEPAAGNRPQLAQNAPEPALGEPEKIPDEYNPPVQQQPASGLDANPFAAPAASTPPTLGGEAPQPAKATFWTAGNMRKLVYVGLVLAVVAVALAMTRGRKGYSSSSDDNNRRAI